MPTDDVGRVIVIDFGRESVSQPCPKIALGTADEPGEWQSLGDVARRVLKQSIVAAGMSGAISRRQARRLMARMDLRGV